MIRNMKIWQKLVLAGLLAVIPVVILAMLFLQSRNEQITRAESELAGLEYVTPMRQLLERLPQHRNAASALLNGDTAVEQMLINAQAQVDAAVAAISAIDGRSGRGLGTSAPWNSIRVRC